MTVSRVINRSGYISHETRQRVEQAIAELGYVPNSLARSLRFKQTKTLALILTDITNPYFTTMARGVEDVASENGFSVIFANTDESAEEESEQLNVLAQKQTDGVLLVPARSSAEPVDFLQRQGVPVVVLDRRVPGGGVDVVRCDSEQGAHDLIRLLLSLGHRRIAALAGPEAVSTAADRVAGYRRALAEAGLPEDPDLISFGEYTQAGGQRMAEAAMSMQPRPTALFAANNFIAIGAYRYLRQAGLRVPEDVALVAFDDLPAAIVMEPFLTVASQPAYEMGRRATELLLDRLAGNAPEGFQEIVLPTELIVRLSSGDPLPAAGGQPVQTGGSQGRSVDRRGGPLK
jgi:LacI family transcriptional regulator